MLVQHQGKGEEKTERRLLSSLPSVLLRIEKHHNVLVSIILRTYLLLLV